MLFAAPLLAACTSSAYLEPPEITNHVDDWRDEVIYQLIVDRFANGDANNDWGTTNDPDELNRYFGGDYQGIIDNVDYLTELGVTAIWISPVVVNVEEDAGIAGYHGYWTQDFTEVNPHFGDLAKLRELVAVMHSNDIKVIVDIVTNHIGQLFYYDINHNGQPDITTWYSADGSDTLDVVTEWDPAYDPRGIQAFTSLGESGDAPVQWVWMPELNRIPPWPPEFQQDSFYNQRGRVTDWGDMDHVVYGDFPGGLKDLATENPYVRESLIQIFSDWITQTNIDGYRIDTVKHIEPGFWDAFAPAIRQHAAGLGKEKFFLFGEVFDGDDALIGSYSQGERLDSLFYFSQKYTVFDGVFKYGGPTSAIAGLYDQRDTNYGTEPHADGIGVAPRDALVNFLDNHDVARFLFDNPDQAALESALVWLFTQDGVPCLYYGTEQGFDGGNDPDNREPLWITEPPSTGGDLFQHVADLTALRAAYEPLRRGTMSLTWTTDHTGDESDAGIAAFERWGAEGTALVVVNTSDSNTSSTAYDGAAMAVGFPAGTELVAVFPRSAGASYVVDSDGTVEITLGPRESMVLVPAGEVVDY